MILQHKLKMTVCLETLTSPSHRTAKIRYLSFFVSVPDSFQSPGSRVQWLWWSAGPGICCVTKNMAAIVSCHTFLFFACVCVCACVWLLSLIWKQLTPLSCSAGCNPNQTKALSPICVSPPLSLSLSLSLPFSPLFSNPQSKLSRLSIFPLHPAL